MADEDSVHDAIVRDGPQILEHGLPFIIVAARWRRDERQRRELRRRELRRRFLSSEAEWPRWDPYHQIAQSLVLRELADALADLSDRDVLAVWNHMKGDSDDEILQEWKRLGIAPKDAIADDVLKRRKAALAHLRRVARGMAKRHPNQVRFCTGETCTIAGAYLFDGFLDGTLSTPPHSEEIVITLSEGEVFPGIESTAKAVWWKHSLDR